MNRTTNPMTKCVRNFAAAILVAGIALAASAAPVRADQWSKTYQVNGRADLRVMTGDGDVIVTGMPNGVGVFREPKIALQDGDVMEIEVEGIGVLRNAIRVEA